MTSRRLPLQLRPWIDASALVALVFLSGCALPGAEPRAGGRRQSLPDLFEAASPSVVMITGQSINPYRLHDRIRHVLGSGVIVNDQGLVLTNSHVVFNVQTLTVTLDNGIAVPARVVGADPIFDIALVEIPVPEKTKLPVARLGDSDRLRTGEEVVAIGNPMGLDQTMTRGIVSGLNRILPETPLSLNEPMIQTDTPINPGNSGGPLVNLRGEVVGLNTAILPEAENIGFAIPINLVKTVMPRLLKDGRVIRPWIGFHGQLIDEELIDTLQMPLVEGMLVEVVEPGSPAQKAGIRGGSMELYLGGNSLLLGGDIIVSINDTSTVHPEKFAETMRGLAVGAKVKIKLYRDGEFKEVEYELPERPLLPGDLSESGGLEALALRLRGSLPRPSRSRTTAAP